MRTRLRLRMLRLAFLLSGGGVFILALLPAPSKPELFGWQDKVEHLLLFAALTVLGFVSWPRHWRTIVVAMLAYGGAMELAQSLTGYRVGDVLDWIADAIGIALATAFMCHRVHRGPS